MKVRIFLPPPDPKLNAHNKGHWRVKAPVVKARRAHARMIAKQEMNALGIVGKWPRARLSYQFYVPDNARRDRANMMQQEKASVDGVTDAELIAGDHWQVLEFGTCEVVIRKAKPGTVLIFERMDD